MALIAPQATVEDVDRHGAAFREMARELTA
jgi:hypothetical protein